jgi:hypothetical protein
MQRSPKELRQGIPGHIKETNDQKTRRPMSSAQDQSAHQGPKKTAVAGEGFSEPKTGLKPDPATTMERN